MGSHLRDPVAPVVSEDAPEPPAPVGAGRARRLLAVAVAVAALVAFTSLARPQGSPSSRLRIGDSDPAEGPSVGAEGAPDQDVTAGPAAGRGPNDALLRPLDPSTLADVPANLLDVHTNDGTYLSDDGALLAVPDFRGGNVGDVNVVDARTFQPVATIDLEGVPISNLLGFTPEADALVVQRGNSFRGQTLTRYPLDPEEHATTVELPDRLDAEGQPAALLAGGRIAMLAAERGGGNGELASWTLHVLVGDLLAERVVVDLPLPDLLIDQPDEVVPDGPLYYPGLAWDVEGERLYVAHADAGRVTVIDLAAGNVQAEADLDSRLPGPPSLADGGTRWKSAQLGPDGSRLYVTGRDYLRAGPGLPLGLSVIDTATLTEVGYVAGVSDWSLLSPDGRWLAWTIDGTGAPPSGVGLLDAATLEQVALLGDGDGFSSVLGFARDSAHLYLHSNDAEGGSTGVVRAYALPSLEQTGERRLPTNGWFEPSGAYLRDPG